MEILYQDVDYLFLLSLFSPTNLRYPMMILFHSCPNPFLQSADQKSPNFISEAQYGIGFASPKDILFYHLIADRGNNTILKISWGKIIDLNGKHFWFYAAAIGWPAIGRYT